MFQESGSETEEESWKGRIEQGVYTEKVKQKSKSVTDLMVLVHIDPDSDAEWSMGAQTSEKNVKKKLSVTGSDSDLRHTVPTDEFDEALKKLRDPLPSNAANKVRSLENLERPKLLTLTIDQGQTPILRLSLDSTGKTSENNDGAQSVSADSTQRGGEKHVLRLLSKGDPDLPLLRYVPDQMSSVEEVEKKEDDDKTRNKNKNNILLVNKEDSDDIPNHFVSDNTETNTVDVLLWNHALDSALEHKVPGFSDEAEFNEYIDASTERSNTTAPELTVTAVSTPDAPQFCNSYSIYTADDSFSMVENAEVDRKPLPNDDEEERKQLSTPDDEQSSDSGFRDKESCEEEEAICSTSDNPLSSVNSTAVSRSSYSEEEPFQILFELDTILDAEYYATSAGPESITENAISNVEKNVEESKQNISDSNHASVKADVTNSDSTQLSDMKESPNRVKVRHENVTEDIKTEEDVMQEEMQEVKSDIQPCDSEAETCALKLDTFNIQRDEQCSQGDYENEDEDSSTVSLRSDNSYVSFGMEEEFVTAIRNELREKLPQAQMQIVESLEAHDDENPSISDDAYDKQWDDEDSEDLSSQVSGGVDISIRYDSLKINYLIEN